MSIRRGHVARKSNEIIRRDGDTPYQFLCPWYRFLAIVKEYTMVTERLRKVYFWWAKIMQRFCSNESTSHRRRDNCNLRLYELRLKVLNKTSFEEVPNWDKPSMFL